MKQSKSFVEERRKALAQILQEEGRVAIADLAERLGVSPLTVRRDVDFLEESGLVYRRYGEAVLVTGEARRVAELRASGAEFAEHAKEAIAAAAAERVERGDSIFVNTSSTALLTIEKIQATDVTIITNSTRAADLLASPTMTLLITGGQVTMPRGVLSGEFALANLRSVSAKRSFVGCAGISASAGVTSTTLQEATVNSIMLERSDFRVLLADSTKLGVEAGFTYADVSTIDLLITDTQAPADALERLRAAGIGRILQVEPRQ